ncbi:hypothetical protein BX600DRAFT_469912 [Xylariales sp. PMI_506]|nr:hypothetical protein BX600DRAFT_469912 [Xylariales sp. PMI_506]
MPPLPNNYGQAESTSFSRLPHEIENRIWEFAAICPKVVTVRLRDDKNNAVYTSEGLSRTCKTSRGIYLLYNKNYILFEYDYFCINVTGFCSFPGYQVQDHLSIRPLSRFGRIAIPIPIHGISDMFKCLPRLQELWVYPVPINTFQRNWAEVHHCRKAPENYVPEPFCDPKIRIICPAYHWRSGFGSLDNFVMAPRTDYKFRLMYPTSLPAFPVADDICRSTYPVIRWVREDKVGYQGFPQLNTEHRKHHLRVSAIEYLQARGYAIINNQEMIRRLKGEIGPTNIL